MVFMFIWVVTIANFILALFVGFSFVSPVPVLLMVSLAAAVSVLKLFRQVRFASVALVAWTCSIPVIIAYDLTSIYRSISV